jgi:hypothetical protein
MAGTATRYNPLTIPMGIVAQLWANLAVPAAAARITLDADGTPDATANPNAKHLGHTDAGLTVTARETNQDWFADENPFPIGPGSVLIQRPPDTSNLLSDSSQQFHITPWPLFGHLRSIRQSTPFSICIMPAT